MRFHLLYIIKGYASKNLEIIYDKLVKGEVQALEEVFIMYGKNFRLEGNKYYFELQGDLSEAIKYLKGEIKV